MTDIMQDLAARERAQSEAAGRAIMEKRIRDSFKSAVPPEAMHARREFKRGGFVMLWFAVAALWTCLGICLVNNWDWVSAVVGAWR